MSVLPDRRSAAIGLRVEQRPRLGRWAAAWDELVDRAPLPSPFLRSWWLEAMEGGEPTFVLALDGDTLVGGVALQRKAKGGCDWYEMLGDGPLEPDHLDLVADPQRVAAVIAAVASWVSRPGDRVFCLRGLVDSSWLAGALPSRAVLHRLQVAPYVPLPPTMAEYLAGRSGQVRSTIKRTTKRLSGAGIEARVRDPTDVEVALEDLHRLHDARWGDESSFLDAWPAFARAMAAGAAAGEVRFTDLVDGDGRVVAIEAELIVAGRASFYQAGRLDDHDLRGSGSALKGAVIGRLIDDGCREFDLLRGDERYKTEWATAERRVMMAEVGIGPRGMAVSAAARLKQRFLVARYVARNRLKAQLASVTKSMSSSTAPTSDGSRSR